MVVRTKPSTSGRMRTRIDSSSASDGGMTLALSQLSLSLPESTPTLRGGSKSKKKKIVARFNKYFGSVSKLENWQKLCMDLGVEPVPSSLTQCRKALRGIWVNIHDFLDNKESGSAQVLYKTESALAEYTIREDKIYPKKAAKEGGPVRALLARIF